MIVTCPSCSANYRIKAEIIDPQKGRVVRCSACGNNWRVFAESPPLQQHQLPDLQKNEPKIVSKKLKKHKKSSFMTWVLTIIGLNILIFGLGYIFRKDVVKQFPQTERFFQIFGIDVTVTGISLVMPYLEKISHADGRISLLIQGSFLNSHAQNTLKIPPLKIVLLNNANLPVASFIKSDFNPDSLLAGGRSDFTYEIPNLPKEAVDVRIEFETNNTNKIK
jgi:predicted Zn finger-like uncharacterized protein